MGDAAAGVAARTANMVVNAPIDASAAEIFPTAFIVLSIMIHHRCTWDVRPLWHSQMWMPQEGGIW
ncbi:hypothetical protein GCM10009765_43380 [Fodinicola feengrottensis]|uniref:Uncharacterized protein n=1 Tax=Fodinicola feengrottensis TaxID=435914 RepID=A0ABN2HK70_9ACTN